MEVSVKLLEQTTGMICQKNCAECLFTVKRGRLVHLSCISGAVCMWWSRNVHTCNPYFEYPRPPKEKHI